MNSRKPQQDIPNLLTSQDGATTAGTELSNWTTTLAGCTEVCSQKSEKGLKQLKQKKCKVCKTLFTPNKPLQAVCSVQCAVGIAEKKKALEHAKERRETAKADKVKREKLKTRSEYVQEAQYEFNRYIRLRDKGKGCISCGTDCGATAIGGSGDAGHFRSRGSAPHLRFDERNCHLQCKKCNRYLAGNVANYRIGLIERIGLKAVEELESDQTPAKRSIADLQFIKSVFKIKYKELEKSNG